jgi:peroxiredoxin
VEIVGVSFDDPEVNRAWAEEEGFPFELWTDSTSRTLALTYGAADDIGAPFADRVTMLLDADTVLLLEYLDVSIATGPQETLDDCTVLFGGG